jgi:hypothetical protein
MFEHIQGLFCMKLAYRDEYQKIWNLQGRKGPLSLLIKDILVVWSIEDTIFFLRSKNGIYFY